ncbi:MAG: hypothetical protein U1A27_13755 [Phycisphaerae bacterium]
MRLRYPILFALLALMLVVLSICRVRVSVTPSTAPVICCDYFELCAVPERPASQHSTPIKDEFGRAWFRSAGAGLDLCGVDLVRIESKRREDGQCFLLIRAVPDAKKNFFDWTTAHKGKTIAILIDGRLRSASVTTCVAPIREQLLIPGFQNIEEAESIASTLRIGGYPVHAD